MTETYLPKCPKWRPSLSARAPSVYVHAQSRLLYPSASAALPEQGRCTPCAQSSRWDPAEGRSPRSRQIHTGMMFWRSQRRGNERRAAQDAGVKRAHQVAENDRVDGVDGDVHKRTELGSLGGLERFMAQLKPMSTTPGIMPMMVATHHANTKLIQNIGQIQPSPGAGWRYGTRKEQATRTACRERALCKHPELLPSRTS